MSRTAPALVLWGALAALVLFVAAAPSREPESLIFEIEGEPVHLPAVPTPGWRLLNLDDSHRVFVVRSIEWDASRDQQTDVFIGKPTTVKVRGDWEPFR